MGADIWGQLLQDGRRIGKANKPCAIRTHLGWIVFGPVGRKGSDFPGCQSLASKLDYKNVRLETLLQRFWDLEEPEIAEGEDMDECESIFKRTVGCDDQGRYVVQIPFRGEAPALGGNFTN